MLHSCLATAYLIVYALPFIPPNLDMYALEPCDRGREGTGWATSTIHVPSATCSTNFPGIANFVPKTSA